MVDTPKPDHLGIPHRRPPLTRRQIIAQAVVAGVILVSGVGIGVGGTILVLKDRIVMKFPPAPFGRPAGPEPNDIAQGWKAEYELTDQQTQKIKDTLTRQFTAIRKLRQDFDAAEQEERQKLNKAVKSIFTPEQFAKWDQKMKEMAQHWQRMRPFGGRGGGRGGRPPGFPKDPNAFRGDGSRPRFMGPDGYRGDRPPRDSNAPRLDGAGEPLTEPNSRPEISPVPGEISPP